MTCGISKNSVVLRIAETGRPDHPCLSTRQSPQEMTAEARPSQVVTRINARSLADLNNRNGN